MKKRWAIYIIIGVLFGIFDSYYQEFISGIVTSDVMSIIEALGIWLVPAIPVVIYESKTSKSRKMAALANMLTWSVSIISYYLYQFFKLVFIGQPSMQLLHISNYKDQYYFSNLKSVFWDGVIIEGISQWIAVAVIGGIITGVLISNIYLRSRKTPITKLIDK